MSPPWAAPISTYSPETRASAGTPIPHWPDFISTKFLDSEKEWMKLQLNPKISLWRSKETNTSTDRATLETCFSDLEQQLSELIRNRYNNIPDPILDACCELKLERLVFCVNTIMCGCGIDSNWKTHFIEWVIKKYPQQTNLSIEEFLESTQRESREYLASKKVASHSSRDSIHEVYS